MVHNRQLTKYLFEQESFLIKLKWRQRSGSWLRNLHMY